MKYKQLKLNDAFMFEPSGHVFVRCRGGFRSGRGGELIKFSYPDAPVFIYQSFTATN